MIGGVDGGADAKLNHQSERDAITCDTRIQRTMIMRDQRLAQSDR